MSTDFTVELEQLLDKWNEEFQEMTDDVMKSVANETANQLRLNSPMRTGDYASSWSVKKNKKTMGWIVYNKTHYRLTHLLENGHANRNGGRTPAYVHIAPVAEWASNQVQIGIAQRSRKK